MGWCFRACCTGLSPTPEPEPGPLDWMDWERRKTLRLLLTKAKTGPLDLDGLGASQGAASAVTAERS